MFSGSQAVDNDNNSVESHKQNSLTAYEATPIS